MPAQRELTTILVMLGTWAILFGTILYWPLERFNDWLERSSFFGQSHWLSAGRRMRVWIREDRRRQWTFRALYIVAGIICILLAFT
jgi:hypothetical protein